MSMLARVAVCIVVALGCGEEDLRPYGHLDVVFAGSLPEDGALRGGVVWRDDTAPGRGVVLGDDRALNGESFAMAFQPSAQAEADPHPMDGPSTRGNLVAYVDTNGDGRFSFTAPGNHQFRDRIVGWLPGVRLVFAPRPPPNSRYSSGLVILRERP